MKKRNGHGFPFHALALGITLLFLLPLLWMLVASLRAPGTPFPSL